MNNLVKDWCDYREVNANFDQSHFSTLFIQDLNDQELNEVFKFFSSSKDLIERLKTVIGLREFRG